MRLALLLQVASLEKPDARPVPATSAWLVGTWLHSADKDDLERVACKSGTTFTYRAGGKTDFFEGKGRWQLRRDRLTETVTEIDGTFAEPALVAQIGTSDDSHLIRIGPHEGVRVLTDGTRDRMLRCRPGDIQ
jgi:hypothetical protein